jgi:hypothetical protein
MPAAWDDDTGSRLAELERLYNGPIPPQARAIALLGTPAMVMLVRARAEAAFFRCMARGQLRAIRRRRADGSFYAALIDDLRLYLRHYRAWRHLAATLAMRLEPPRATAKPTMRSPASSGRGFGVMAEPPPDPRPGMMRQSWSEAAPR